jgi:hypothetical protein
MDRPAIHSPDTYPPISSNAICTTLGTTSLHVNARFRIKSTGFDQGALIQNSVSEKTNDAVMWLSPVFWVWVVVLVFAVVGPVYHDWKRVSAPFELDYGEGALMWQVQHVLDRGIAYGSLENGPLVIWNYPPLYLLAVRAVWKISGDLLWSGRFVSYVSGVGVEFLLAAIIYAFLPRRFGRLVRLWAAGTGLLFLSTEAAFIWVPLMRVDLLGLLATYAGIFLFLSAGKASASESGRYNSPAWRAYLAFGCFFVAAYVKQTYIAAPIVCFLVALVMAPKHALRLGLLLGVPAAVVFWLGMVWTHGGFVRHLITYNVHRLSVGRALSGLSANMSNVRLHFVLLGMLVLLGVLRASGLGVSATWRYWTARMRRSPLRLALTVELGHWLICLVLSFTYGKTGSNVNYFLESNAALCVAAGLGLGILLWEVRRAARQTAMAALVLAMPLVLAGQTFYTVANSFVKDSLTKMHERDQMEAYRQFKPRMASAPGPVLSDDMVLLLWAGKDVIFEPATMCMMAEVGTWDESGFERRLESKEFGLIMVSRPQIWDARLLAALQKAYQLDSSVWKYQLYRPR